MRLGDSKPSPSPFHEGEKRLQARAGVAERMESFGRRVIRDHMPQQHQDFYRQLPFILLGAVDADGRPWASLMEDNPGFAHATDDKHLALDARLAADDPVAATLVEGAAIGLLGIELQSRRRNRLNGRIQRANGGGISVAVEHAFGNCPQYISTREPRFVADPREFRRQQEDAGATRVDARSFADIDARARAMVDAADTFFVASYVDIDGQAQRRSVDVSHRGGKPGFVRREGDLLSIPDFAGNLHFNTLGNLLLNPQAGLLFIDFDNGDVLQVSGRTALVLDGADVAAFRGAERLWTVQVERIVYRPAALALRWAFRESSPNNLLTGSWQEALARQRAQALRTSWRPFRVTRIENESANIRSFYLEPTDGAGIPAFESGQHLPVRVVPSSDGVEVIRTYSISSAPSDACLRISVKRQGLVSSYLHDHVRVGSILQARAPQGTFVVDASAHRPLVLLAAGVGVTPLLSMLRHVVYEGQRTRRTRPTYFFQSARTLAERPFAAELAQLAAIAGNSLRTCQILSTPEGSARPGEHFDVAGRMDIQLLKAWLPFDDHDFYLCGPTPFTQQLYDELRAMHIPDLRIHAESFGPSTLARKPDDGAAPTVVQPPAADNPVAVLFAHSAKEARWTPGSGTLLELAEARGLNPPYSCRNGVCGTCSTRIINGAVHYPQPPSSSPAAGEALLCCAVPAALSEPGGSLVLDL